MSGKFFGTIGYSAQVEKRPGVWVNEITERKAYGDVLRNSRRFSEGERRNGDISISNRISVIMDAFSRDNFHAIRYVNWMGALWTVDEVEVESPRLIMRLGGVWNGEKASVPAGP
jgi:hypothetical protein